MLLSLLFSICYAKDDRPYRFINAYLTVIFFRGYYKHNHILAKKNLTQSKLLIQMNLYSQSLYMFLE